MLDPIIFPLALTDDTATKKAVESRRTHSFLQRLANALNARLSSFEDFSSKAGTRIYHYQSPVVPCVFFNEGEKPLVSRSSQLFWPLASFPVYIMVSSRTFTYYSRFWLEIEFLYNISRPFMLVGYDEISRSGGRDILDYLREEIKKYTSFVDGRAALGRLQSYGQLQGIFRNSFVRIFREDFSISCFYAMLEFILSVVHIAAVLLDASEISDDLKLEQCLPFKQDYVDGKILSYAKKSAFLLGKNGSPMSSIFTENPGMAVSSAMLKVMNDLEIRSRTRHFSSWVNVFEAIVAVRNKTKGHGVVYRLANDTIWEMFEVSVALMDTLAKNYFVLVNSEGEFLRTSYLRYAYKKPRQAVDDFENVYIASTIEEASSAKTAINMKYSTGEGFFLFSGADAANENLVYYKSYYSGKTYCLDKSIKASP